MKYLAAPRYRPAPRYRLEKPEGTEEATVAQLNDLRRLGWRFVGEVHLLVGVRFVFEKDTA